MGCCYYCLLGIKDCRASTLELGKKAMLLTYTHRQMLGREVRPVGAKKGGGSREATGSCVSLGGVD